MPNIGIVFSLKEALKLRNIDVLLTAYSPYMRNLKLRRSHQLLEKCRETIRSIATIRQLRVLLKEVMFTKPSLRRRKKAA